MNDLAAARAAYNRDAVLSASPARLLTMLYDRLLLDLQRAEAAQAAQKWDVASQNLMHAQAIVGELAASLKPELWEGGDGLLALYQYVTRSLVNANVHRAAERTRECIALLEPLRAAWHEAAGATPATPVRAFA
ncbi:MAG: flagellar export chaperone FliS [Actinomycetota bacterium]|nr:flagellar export chaperone FliS [Actinomycetota bacterium]